MAAKAKKRRLIVAALLSLLLPGLGQLYAGKGRVAALWMAIAVFLQLVVYWGLLPIDRMLLLRSGFWLMMSLVALAVAWQLWAIVDAALSARRAGVMALKRYQHWYVYTALAVLFLGPLSVVDTGRLKPLPAFSIPSGSMSPTLRVGDRVVASGNWFESRPPARGEIAIYKRPSDLKTDWVKRIVGLPGDRVQYKQGRLYLNGEIVERVSLTPAEVEALQFSDEGRVPLFYWEQMPGGARYVIAERSDDEAFDNTNEFTVPPAHVFVLGDNRDDSLDSRSDGFVPVELLRAKPLHVFWSGDWGRIGERFE